MQLSKTIVFSSCLLCFFGIALGEGFTDDLQLSGSAIFPGDFYDVDWHNGYVWIADGKQDNSGNLKAIDVSDPDNPMVAVTVNFPGEKIFRLHSQDNILFISIPGRGVVLYDIADPLNPAYLDEFNTIHAINDLTSIGIYLFIHTSIDGIIALDISDPMNLQFVSQLSDPGISYSMAVKEAGVLALVKNSMVKFFDVTDPYDMVYLSSYSETGKYYFDTVCQGNLFYVIYRNTMINSGGFTVIDVTDPLNPQRIAQPTTFGVDVFPNIGLDISGDTLFFAAGQTGMKIYDVSVPSSPTPLGTWGAAMPWPPDFARWSARVTYGGGYAHTISPDRFDLAPTLNEFCMIDISDLTDPVPRGIIDTPAYTFGVTGNGDFAYVGCGKDGLYVVDVSDPGSMEIAADVDMPVFGYAAKNLLYENNILYFNGGPLAIASMSVEDPANPQMLMHQPNGYTQYYDLDKEGDLLVTVGWGVSPNPPGWIETYYAGDPANIVMYAMLVLNADVEGVDLVGDLAYAASDEGLHIVDVSNPANPWQITLFETFGGANDVVVSGNTAFMAKQNSKLAMIDVSNPGIPRFIGEIDLPSIPLELKLAGNTLYAAATSMVVEIDVSNPASPVITDVEPMSGLVRNVDIVEGNLLVSDKFGFHYFQDVQPPGLTVNITPMTAPVYISSAVNAFDYWLEVSNYSGSVQIFDAWIDGILPGGGVYEVMNRQGISLGGGAELRREMSQNIPLGAPGGSYSYRASIGDFPDDPVSQDSFEFVKFGSDGAANGGGWNLEGWGCRSAVNSILPDEFMLGQNYPNPFNPDTNIDFEIPEMSDVKVAVYDVLGREVSVLLRGSFQPGRYSVTWDGAKMSGGVYFVRMQARGYVKTVKAVLVK